MEIDLGALAHNYRAIRERVGAGTEIIPALKGNAYGHGAGAVAGCLGELGVRRFATGSLEDALEIRAAAQDAQVMLFGGPLPQGIPRVLTLGFTPTVYNDAGVQAVARAATRPTGVCVKVDAGLGRLGVPLRSAFDFIRGITESGRRRDSNEIFVEGVYTHLPFDDAAGLEWARERLADFDELLAALAADGIEVRMSQALASAAILAGVKSRATAVCPGHLLYGLSPVDARLAELTGAAAFRPVLKSIRSWLIHVHAPGPGAGYGGGGAPARVGVVPLGLVDGYQSLRAGSGARALIGGRSVPILGVSLEYLSLDLSGLDSACEGDAVVLLGRSGDDEITLDDLAAWQGTLPHRVLMSLNRRLPCRYLQAG